MPIDLSKLNDEQRRAVLTTEGPLLVLAGPGSGKTRVTTHRVAHIVDLGQDPRGILAITFTNKAAGEMRHRISGLLGGLDLRDMWITTFHSMCVRMLRASSDRLGLGRFNIYDEDDVNALIKSVVKDLDLDGHPAVSRVRERISEAKNELIDHTRMAAHALSYEDERLREREEITAQVYRNYMQRLRAARALDFDDLLFETVRLLEGHAEVRKHYNDLFHHVHVDEYQDTNHAQYKLVSLLSSTRKNVMVVGDEDQGIYGWRGADVRNIKNFQRDFPGVTTIALGENYRSSGRIVAVTSSIITKNLGRNQKRLFTQNAPGEPVRVHTAADGDDEAAFVVGEIQKHLRAGRKPKELAILYRTGAQSRTFEQFLVRASIPYLIVKGTAFFDRAEVKDAIALLRIVDDPAHDMALLRVLTSKFMPKRRIGKDTLEKIAAQGTLQEIVGLEAAMREASIYGWKCVSTATLKAIDPFLSLLDELRRIVETEPDLPQAVSRVFERYGVIEAVRAADDGEDDRAGNVVEIVNLVSEFAVRTGADGDGTLPGFLEWIALQQGEMGGSGSKRISAADADAVKLMTAHAAKGLEFPVVFVVGVEEEFMPHFNVLTGDPGQVDQGLAEERRLVYVAATRAEQHLYLVNAKNRMVNGKWLFRRPSRFLDGIPEAHVRRTAAAPPQKQGAPHRRW